MVTIDPDKPVPGIFDLKKPDRAEETSGTPFNTIFQEAIGSTAGKSASTESAAFLSDIRPAQFSAQQPPAAGMVVDQVENLIETMSAYQRQLADAGTSLKAIQPLVAKMESQNRSLAALSTSADEGDAELKSIVHQSLSLSALEIARFKSGHYTDD